MARCKASRRWGSGDDDKGEDGKDGNDGSSGGGELGRQPERQQHGVAVAVMPAASIFMRELCSAGVMFICMIKGFYR